MGQGSSSSSSSSSAAAAAAAADLTVRLPDECLGCVFGKLGCDDRNNCSLVCKRWMEVDSKSRQRLILFARSSPISTSLPYLLSRFNSIKSLSLKCSRKLVSSIDDHSLASIPTFLPSLTKLKLKGKGCLQITDSALISFSEHHPPLLSNLSLASCGVTTKAIVSLILNCPSLKNLTLKRLRKLDAQTQTQSHFNDINNNKLERLCIKDLHNARLFIPLVCSSAHTLKALIVCRSFGNWDPVLETLNSSTSSSIVEIQMENVQMGDLGLVSISTSCPLLQLLYLSRATDCTDDGLSAIANSCKKLRKLHIDVWSRFGSRGIGEEGLLSIATKCQCLEELVLMGIPISVKSLNVLASNCPGLERMALCNTDSVGDSEMQFIASKFTALKKLCIKNCPISDSGIKWVGQGCPSLVKLKVKRCRGVTQGSVSKLRMRRRCLNVSMDSARSIPMMLELEDELQSTSASANATANSISSSSSSRTHVICSSRGALLLKSTLNNALHFNNKVNRRRRSS